MRPDPAPLIGPVPHYAAPPGPPAPPPATLSPGDRAVLEGMTFDALHAALGALLAECYRARRTGIAAPVPTTSVVRINGLIRLAAEMTRGLYRPPVLPLLPETVILSQYELVPPLERAMAALGAALDHREKPLDPAWRGFPLPWRDPVAAARGHAQAE